MSELIDRNVLKAKMYQEAFESDTDMQKWDSGCWIRYKLFEKVVDSTPTVPYAPLWHRVEDELPDEVGSYLVYAPTYIGGSSSAKECKAGVMFAKWLKGGHWSIEVGYYKRPGCVTHWMPIEPPKEDA